MAARWWSLAVVTLIVPSLAGCVQDDPVPPPEEAPDVPAWIVPVAEPVDSKVLLANHKAFVKEYSMRRNNSADHLGAREFMAAELTAANLTLLRQPFELGIHQENICGVVLGAREPNVWVVVGGHYDTVANGGERAHEASEGAYDDGSGTRMVIEMAKSYAKIQPYYSVVFCAFDGEERGLHGSAHLFASMADGGSNEDFPYPVDYTRAMLDLDMFGICWPVSVPIAYDQNDAEIYKHMDAARKALGVPDDMWVEAKLAIGSQSLGTSDYGHWKGAHIPTVFYISDFEFMGAPRVVPVQPATPGTPAGVYPFWHQADTYETMEAMAGGAESLEAGFQTAVDLAMATLAAMALDPSVALTIPE